MNIRTTCDICPEIEPVDVAAQDVVINDEEESWSFVCPRCSAITTKKLTTRTHALLRQGGVISIQEETEKLLREFE